MNTNCKEKLAYIKQLCEIDASIGDIYQASPFDHQRNMDNKFTSEIFYNLFYVQSEYYDSKEKELYDDLTSGNFRRKILFLTGYSGIGKTTFLNRFISSHENEFSYYLLDYNMLPEDIVSDEKHPISDGIKFYIAKNFIPKKSNGQNDWLYKTLNHIYDNESEYYQLISTNCIDKIAQFIDSHNESRIKYRKLNELLSTLDEMDTFMIFIVILFINADINRNIVIAFDNLDIVHLDFITKSFTNDFKKLHNNASALSQNVTLYGRIVKFSSRYKFVFVLREANFAKNPHIIDVLGSGYKLFKLKSDSKVSKDILLRRSKIFDCLCEEDEKNASSYDENRRKNMLINRIIRVMAGDEYFQNCIVNMFNCDYKKLFENIRGLLERDFYWRQIEKTFKEPAFNLYEQKGALLYWFINYLVKNEMFANVVRTDRLSDSMGRCDEGRMILNYILNIGGLNWEKREHNKLCNLFQISLAFYKLFTPRNIVEMLYEQYSMHEKSQWTNLITIYNKKVCERLDLSEEEELIEELYSIKDSNSENTNRYLEIMKCLKNIEIGITPAGYALLKYCLIHYENYSNQIKNEQIELKKPLFLFKNEKKKEEYCFKIKAKSIIDIVEDEANAHNRYYNEYFVKKMNYSDGDFENSEYSFKYSRGQKSRNGVYHITRVISSHINYLDNFRLNIFKYEDIEKSEKIDINKIVIRLIKRYVEILSRYSSDHRKDSIVKMLNQQIRRVESDYADFEMKITFPEDK
jgi:hypothetical protein